MTYALDTNMIIHYLKDTPNVVNNLIATIKRGDSLVIPPIVDYEIKRGFCVQSSPKKERAYKILTEESLGVCDVPSMDSDSWERAEKVYAELYQKRFTVGELDMLIAAFCLVNDCTLVTNNKKDFASIDGIVVVDWTKDE